MGADTEALAKQRGEKRAGGTADSLTRDADHILCMMFQEGLLVLPVSEDTLIKWQLSHGGKKVVYKLGGAKGKESVLWA